MDFVLLSNYFAISFAANPISERLLLSTVNQHLKREFLCRKGRFIDKNDIVYVNESENSDHFFQIVFGFSMEICRPYRKDGSQPFLLNINAKLYCLDAGFNLIIYNKLSHTYRDILRHQASVPADKCFEKIRNYVTKLAQSIRYKDIFVDLNPIEFEAKILPMPSLLPSKCDDGGDSLQPFYDTNFEPVRWSIISLNEKRFEKDELQSLRDRIIGKAEQYGIRALTKENCVECQSIRIDSLEQMGCHFSQLATDHQIQLAIVLINQDIKLANGHKAQTVFDLSAYLARKNAFISFNYASFEFLDDDDGQHSQSNSSIDRLLIRLCRTFDGLVNVVDRNHLNQIIQPCCPSFDIGRTMLIGCYHRKQGQKSATSFWISLDEQMKKCVKLNRFTPEHLEEALEQYKQLNGQYPDFIFLFRNLLPFEKVPNVYLNAMIEMIQSTMAKLQLTCKLTCLLVEKKPRECIIASDARSLYGTMAEAPFKQYLMIGYRSFCLFADNSNYGLKLLRPTKYHVIWDQMQLPGWVLAEFCFSLCHYSVDSFFVNDIPVCLELADQLAKLQIQMMNAQEFMSNQ